MPVKHQQRLSVFVVIAVFGAAGFLWAAVGSRHEHAVHLRHSHAHGFYWTCSMHPQVRLDRDGNCPICGMKLLQRGSASSEDHFIASAPAAPAGASTDGIVSISAQVLQNLGVRTAAVSSGRLVHRVAASGRIEVDPRRIAVLGARATGWIERLHVHFAGEPVRRGQVLAEIYAPALLKAQQEFVVSLDVGDPELIASTREQLELLGVGTTQVTQLARTRKPQRRVQIASTIDGFLLELGVSEGAQVMPDTQLFKLGDLARVWVTADIPESQAGWLTAGTAMTVRVPALPGWFFAGAIDYVYPELGAVTRSLRVRSDIDNHELKLKAGMTADIVFTAAAAQPALLVPSESVIRTGTRDVVLIAEGNGRFRPAEVQTGGEGSGFTAILSGISAGQHVVTSGQFLIDSEANLQGAYSRLGAAARPGNPAAADENTSRNSLSDSFSSNTATRQNGQ